MENFNGKFHLPDEPSEEEMAEKEQRIPGSGLGAILDSTGVDLPEEREIYAEAMKEGGPGTTIQTHDGRIVRIDFPSQE